MKSTDLLIQDHHVILRTLDVLDHMAARVEQEQPLETEDVKAILRILRGFADNYHQGKEECALFPELIRILGEKDGPVRQMIFEHDQERSLVEGIEDALHTKKGIEFVQFAAKLSSLIRNHIHKEDNILFRIAAESLSARDDERIVSELGKFQFDLGYLADLRRLEWAYLRRAA
jgi:hemerythrin-like domain-containing protein